MGGLEVLKYMRPLIRDITIKSLENTITSRNTNVFLFLFNTFVKGVISQYGLDDLLKQALVNKQYIISTVLLTNSANINTTLGYEVFYISLYNDDLVAIRFMLKHKYNYSRDSLFISVIVNHGNVSMLRLFGEHGFSHINIKAIRYIIDEVSGGVDPNMMTELIKYYKR
jgi:hypothetical protein